MQDTYGDGNQNWTIVTITVTDGDDLPARFSKYLYEVLVDVNTPKVGASESMQLYSLVVKKVKFMHFLISIQSTEHG